MTAWEHGRLTTHPAGAGDGYRSNHSFETVGGKVQLSDPGASWEHTLTRLGLDGWEIAAIDRDTDDKGRPFRVMYLKRQLP